MGTCPFCSPSQWPDCPHWIAVLDSGWLRWADDFEIATTTPALANAWSQRQQLVLGPTWKELAADIPFWEGIAPDFTGTCLAVLNGHPGARRFECEYGWVTVLHPDFRTEVVGGLNVLTERLRAEYLRSHGREWEPWQPIPRAEVSDERWKAAHPFQFRCPLCETSVRRGSGCPHLIGSDDLARIPHLAGDALDDHIDLPALAHGLQPWESLPEPSWFEPTAALALHPLVFDVEQDHRRADVDGGTEGWLVVQHYLVSEFRDAVEREVAELLARLDALQPSYRRRLAKLRASVGRKEAVESLSALSPAGALRLLLLGLDAPDVEVARGAARLAQLSLEEDAPGGAPGTRIGNGFLRQLRALLPGEMALQVIEAAAQHRDDNIRETAAQAHRQTPAKGAAR